MLNLLNVFIYSGANKTTENASRQILGKDLNISTFRKKKNLVDATNPFNRKKSERREGNPQGSCILTAWQNLTSF